MDPLYLTSITCICCETPYKTSRVRPSFKKAASRDSDFCTYYKDDINPDYYVVRVCPTCGYASTENGLSQLTDKQKMRYYEGIGSQWVFRDYGDTRNHRQALNCYKLALLSAQAVDEKERVIAGILHHIAWLYRHEGNKQQELRFLQFALNAYISVYENEGDILNNAKLMFLIGELYRRLGEAKTAVKWFSRVVNDKKIVDAAMIRASRDMWQQVRNDHADNEIYEEQSAV